MMKMLGASGNSVVTGRLSLPLFRRETPDEFEESRHGSGFRVQGSGFLKIELLKFLLIELFVGCNSGAESLNPEP